MQGPEAPDVAQRGEGGGEAGGVDGPGVQREGVAALQGSEVERPLREVDGVQSGDCTRDPVRRACLGGGAASWMRTPAGGRADARGEVMRSPGAQRTGGGSSRSIAASSASGWTRTRKFSVNIAQRITPAASSSSTAGRA